MVKPTDKTSTLVHEWLRANGIEDLSYSSAKDWISVSLPVSEIERLLDTEYHVYEHEDGDQLVRTSEWSLPRHLHEHIDSIQPTTSFMRPAGQKTEFLQFPPWISSTYTPPTNATISKVCNISSVTPECFMNLYSTKGYKPKIPGLNKVGFNNFLGEIPIRPDAYQFLKKYHPGAEGAAYKFPQVSIADGPVQDGPLTLNQSLEGISREANLEYDPFPMLKYCFPIRELWSLVLFQEHLGSSRLLRCLGFLDGFQLPKLSHVLVLLRC